MSTAKVVQDIARNQAEQVINSGIVRAIRGQYLDMVMDGTGKQIREVLVSNTITQIDVGWWVVVARIPRAAKWIALVAFETVGQGSVPLGVTMPQPANVAVTGKPYLIELYWEGSFKDVATYEVQHNSSASETGATTIKVEGSNYLYWCAPGTTRYFRVRAVASNFERSTWSDWVNASSDSGEAYMTVGVNAGATDVEWQALVWSNVAGVTGAAVAHTHETAAEGGKLDWDLVWDDAVHNHDGTAAEGGDIYPRWIAVNATGVPDQQGVIALGSVAGTPSIIGGAGLIYSKDFSGIPELCYLDDTGTEVRLTADGGLYGGAKVLMADGGWVGFGPAAARVVIDGSGSNIAVMNANLGVFTATPDDRVEVVGAGMLISDTKADSANKTMRFGCQHWDIDEEPVYFAVISNTAAANSCRMGGSTGAGNAATDVRIFTAANTTTVSGTERVQVATTGDVLIGTTTAPTANSGRVLAFGDNAAQPTMGANTAGIYAYDPTTGTVEMYAVDEAGNDALLTPHRFELFQPDPAEAYPFAYWATNKFLGKKVNVDMSGMIREVERLSGKQFIYEEDIPASSWTEHQDRAKQSVEASRLVDALMREIEIPKSEALEYVEETMKEPTGGMVRTRRYILVGDQVIEEEAPELVDVPTGKMVWRVKNGVRLERRNGKFYRLPREDEIAIEPYLAKRPPQWMKDRRVLETVSSSTFRRTA